MDEVRKLSYAEKVTILAGMNGMSYGKYVATHDTSRLAEKKPEQKKNICRKCGKGFDAFGHKKRRVCDECKAEHQREYQREREAKKREQKG